MISLKKLKEALNKIDDDKLKYFTATHQMSGFENPETKVGVVFFADEELHCELGEIFDKKEINVVKNFVEQIVTATKESVCAELDGDYLEYVSEKEPNELDE